MPITVNLLSNIATAVLPAKFYIQNSNKSRLLTFYLFFPAFQMKQVKWKLRIKSKERKMSVFRMFLKKKSLQCNVDKKKVVQKYNSTNWVLENVFNAIRKEKKKE